MPDGGIGRRARLTLAQQKAVAAGVRRGDRRATEILLVVYKPLIARETGQLAVCYGSLGDYDDAAQEVVEWAVEFAAQWATDPEAEVEGWSLTGYLDRRLRWRRGEKVKVLLRRQRLDAGTADDVEAPVGPATDAVTASEYLEQVAADVGSGSVSDMPDASMDARAAVDGAMAVLVDDYERAMFVLKLQGLTNDGIAVILGVTRTKIRLDWSRRVLPKVRPIFRKYGLDPEADE